MDAVEEIKRRLSASEVIAGYIPTKQAGRNFRALCPFHHEKTPSFMISDEKGIWHCFGCGEGGDIFGFVMKMEGLDFKDALESLARKANVTLEEYGPSTSRRKDKDRFYRILEAATKYYQAKLKTNATATKYLKDRGITESSITEFRLGFAPNTTQGVVKFLAQKDVKPAELGGAGLIRGNVGPKSAPFDLFRSRLMIPLVDTTDRIIGFTGRVLDNGLPKYLNTPQTLLFDKSRFLFGLNLAKTAIRKADAAVVVEGHLDVITSHQVKVRQVVASGGTALTLAQLKQLARFTRNVKLAFDQDAAGIMATERSVAIAQEAGVSLYIVQIGDAKDPDELIRSSEHGLTHWQKAINNAPYVMDWLLEVLPAQYDLATALGKKRLTDRLMSTLNNLKDPVEQDHYVKKLSQLVGTSPGIIKQKLAQTQRPNVQNNRTAVYQASTQPDENRVVEEELLALGITYADTRTSLQDLEADYFSSDERQQLYAYLRKHPEVELASKLPVGLRPLENYIKILLLKGEEGYQDWAPLDRRIESFSLAARLHQLHIKNLRQKINSQIKIAEADGNEARRQELLRQFRDLSRQSAA